MPQNMKISNKICFRFFAMEGPSSDSIESSSLWLIEDIPRKLYARNKKKLLNRFWEIWQKVCKLSIFWLQMVRIAAMGTPLGSSSSWLIDNILRKLYAQNKKSYWTLGGPVVWNFFPMRFGHMSWFPIPSVYQIASDQQLMRCEPNLWFCPKSRSSNVKSHDVAGDLTELPVIIYIAIIACRMT